LFPHPNGDKRNGLFRELEKCKFDKYTIWPL
jgi:hypothetical protein